MAMNTAPAAMLTRRTAAPVRSVTAVLVDSSVFGTVGRNEPCPCGSGRKSKRCCGAH